MRKRERKYQGRPFPFITLAAALDKALNSNKISVHLKAVEIARDWETLVGPAVSKHAQPVSLNRGILTLQTDSSVWRQQLSFMKPQILDRISERFNSSKINDLRIR